MLSPGHHSRSVHATHVYPLLVPPQLPTRYCLSPHYEFVQFVHTAFIVALHSTAWYVLSVQGEQSLQEVAPL